MAEPKFRTSCDACLSSKIKCSQTKPSCSRCIQHGQECVYSQYRKIGRPSNKVVAAHTSQSEQQQQQQQHASKDPKWKQKRTSPNLRSEPTPKHRHRGLPPSDVSVDAQIDGNALFDAPPALPQHNNPNIRSSEVLDVGASNPITWYPVAPIAQDMHDPELLATFGNFDHDMGAPDWADLDSILDMSTKPSLAPDAMQVTVSHNEAIADSHSEMDFFPRTTSSLSCSSLPSQRSAPESPRALSSAIFSHDGQRPPAVPFQLSAHNSCMPRREPLFHSSPRPSLPETSNVGSGSSTPERHKKPAWTNSSNASFFRSYKPPQPPSSDSRCTLQCHVSLTDQLSYISECQAADSSLTLDVLLNLDNQIRTERNKILRCPVCLSKSRRDQTLMLITMVISKLFSLFEVERSIEQPSSSESSSRRNSAFSTRTSSLTSSASISPFPQTSRPLIVGDIQLDNAVKSAFSRHLLRMHLERQMGTVAQLDQILTGAEGRDMSHKFTRELLAEVSKRAEYLLGIMALTD